MTAVVQAPAPGAGRHDGVALAQAALRLAQRCREQGRTAEALAHARAARALLLDARRERDLVLVAAARARRGRP